LTISLYERHVLTHSSVRESAQLMAQSIYSFLPRPVRSLPFFDELMGTNLHDVYEAIFDVEPDLVDEYDELFQDREQDRVGLHSWMSRETGRNGTHTPPHMNVPSESHIPESPVRSSRRASSNPRTQPGQLSGSPRTRKLSLRQSVAEPLRVGITEGQSLGPRSPLSRLFANKLSEADAGPSPVEKLDKVEEGVRRVQELLEDVRKMPVSKLEGEMRELQERQTRIEGLLLMLTRGMRNDHAGSATASRYDTL
jgi:hypothetical protein